MANYRISSVDRAFGVLRTVLDRADAMTLSELSRATGIHKTTLLRLCVTLEHAGMLNKNDAGQYVLGPMSFALGKAYETDQNIDRCVAPTLHAFAGTIKATASLHVQTATDLRACLLRVDGDHPDLAPDVRTGKQIAIAEGATARILRTFSNHNAYLKSSAQTEGYSFSFEERYPGCVAISVPVFRQSGSFYGAISILGPLDRFSPTYCKQILPEVIAIAGSVSRHLPTTTTR